MVGMKGGQQRETGEGEREMGDSQAHRIGEWLREAGSR